MPTEFIWILLAIALIAANLPFASERFFVLLDPPGGQGKKFWMRLSEWFVLYLLVGLIALGLEQKATGHRYSQEWEFYVVTLCLFIVFAIPGFIYRYQIRHLFERKHVA